MRRAATVPLLSALLVLAGCGGSAEAEAPPDVAVVVGGQDVTARPTQYCLDGDWQRYTTSPPILEVSPDTPIALTVPDAVAEQKRKKPDEMIPIIEDLIKLLDDVGEGMRRGRHPDRSESRKVASVLRAVATDLES